jgi:DNA-binding winged helix-turn-helix (wHTH) protein/tetratricopeptide (TPR) repeat protein
MELPELRDRIAATRGLGKLGGMKFGALRQNIVRFGLFEADLQQRFITKGGMRIRLQDQPFQVLGLLLERPGELVTREEIRQKLWPADTYVAFDDGLNTAIKKLRGALGDSADNPRFIETVPRRGYRFLAPVAIVPSPEPVVPATLPDPLSSEVVIARDRTRVVVEKISPVHTWRWVRLGAGIVLAIGAAYIYRAKHEARSDAGPGSRVTPAASLRARPSVAVFSFRNLSNRRESAWLATAVPEMLTTELAAGEELRTIPGENVARMKADLSLPDSDSYARDTLTRVRDNLSTDYVVFGSFFDSGESSSRSLRLDVRMQDARTGEILATFSANGQDSGLSDLAVKVGSELRKKLGAAQLSLAQAATVNASMPSTTDASRAYAEGLQRLRAFDNLGARTALEAAVSADPSFSLAHAALADAWSGLGYDEKAREEAEKAFDLAGPLSREQRLWVEGRYLEATHEWTKAIDTYRSIYRFFPDNLEYGLRLAKVQTSASQGKDALATLAGLRRLPAPASTDPRIDQAAAGAEMAIGDFPKDEAAAARAADKARALGMRHLQAHARHFQCWALHKIGKAALAKVACDEASRIFAAAGDRDMVASLLVTTAAVLEEAGDISGAKARYEEAVPIYREIGDEGGMATALNNLAIAQRNAGDYSASRKTYEESIAVSKRIGDKDSLMLAMGNLGDLCYWEGNLAHAREIFEQLTVAAREMGAKDRIALQVGNLGQVLYAQGDLPGARRAVEEAMSLDEQAGEKRQLGYHLSAMGDLLQAEAKLPEARQYRLQALEIRTELGDKADAADTRVSLADGSIEEGHPDQAEAPAREAIAELKSLNLVDDEAVAYPVLARALLGLRRPAEALKLLESAAPTVGKSHNQDVQFTNAIAWGRVLAANGKSNDAIRSLKATDARATKSGFVGYALDARLALAELDVKTDKATQSSLESLETDAKRKGYVLIGHKALALRDSIAKP